MGYTPVGITGILVVFLWFCVEWDVKPYSTQLNLWFFVLRVFLGIPLGWIGLNALRQKYDQLYLSIALCKSFT